MWHTNANLVYLPLVQRNKGEQECRLGDRRLLLVDSWGRFMSSVHLLRLFGLKKPYPSGHSANHGKSFNSVQVGGIFYGIIKR